MFVEGSSARTARGNPLPKKGLAAGFPRFLVTVREALPKSSNTDQDKNPNFPIFSGASWQEWVGFAVWNPLSFHSANARIAHSSEGCRRCTGAIRTRQEGPPGWGQYPLWDPGRSRASESPTSTASMLVRSIYTQALCPFSGRRFEPSIDEGVSEPLLPSQLDCGQTILLDAGQDMPGVNSVLAHATSQTGAQFPHTSLGSLGFIRPGIAQRISKPLGYTQIRSHTVSSLNPA